MSPELAGILHTASTWVIPVLLAITLHEAAHGYVASLRGDNTARFLGRVTLNPLKHIDPFGTVVLPALLLYVRSPFLFGYAKPVPVNAHLLRNPHRDMALVAAAGPASNLLMAIIAALLIHTLGVFPADAASWLEANCANAIQINAVLAVFNMIPLPPLDGGRVLVGLLPKPLAAPLKRLEPYGMMIVIGAFLILPLIGSHLGTDLDIFSRFVSPLVRETIRFIALITGHT